MPLDRPIRIRIQEMNDAGELVPDSFTFIDVWADRQDLGSSEQIQQVGNPPISVFYNVRNVNYLIRHREDLKSAIATQLAVFDDATLGTNGAFVDAVGFSDARRRFMTLEIAVAQEVVASE